MKNILILFLLTLPVYSKAQSFERNATESANDFVKRIFPHDAIMEFKVMESKFGTATKKIIFFTKKKLKLIQLKNEKKHCLFANILNPANESSNNYSMQTLLITCSDQFSAQVDNAYSDKDKKKNPIISISVADMNRASTRLLLKTYKSFQLKQASENNFVIEEVTE